MPSNDARDGAHDVAGGDRLDRALTRFAPLRPGEGRAVVAAFAYFFFLLSGYYVLRPLRDEMGVASGVANLQWLFTATFIALLIASPIYAAVVARLPRARFIPLVYRFFIANLAIFWLCLMFDVAPVAVARTFFVWISVFNLFAVSVFWSFMADLFASEQGKRLFGLIAAGGTAGGLVGPAVTVSLAGVIGPVNLLILAAAFLEAAVFCAHRLEPSRDVAPSRASKEGARPPSAAPTASSREVAPTREVAPSRAQTTRGQTSRASNDNELGGGWLAGFALLARSPYLTGIALWVTLMSLTATVIYFAQANLVSAASTDPAVRTRLFATIDLTVGILTLIVQVLATGRLVRRFGTGPALAFLPLVFAAGFGALALAPGLAVVIAVQALQRTANFAVSNPAREVLFTAVAREEKYKAKNVIDAVVVRGSDALWGWAFALLRGFGLELTAIAVLAVPISLLWMILAVALGRAQERRAAAAPQGGLTRGLTQGGPS